MKSLYAQVMHLARAASRRERLPEVDLAGVEKWLDSVCDDYVPPIPEEIIGYQAVVLRNLNAWRELIGKLPHISLWEATIQDGMEGIVIKGGFYSTVEGAMSDETYPDAIFAFCQGGCAYLDFIDESRHVSGDWHRVYKALISHLQKIDREIKRRKEPSSFS